MKGIGAEFFVPNYVYGGITEQIGDGSIFTKNFADRAGLVEFIDWFNVNQPGRRIIVEKVFLEDGTVIRWPNTIRYLMGLNLWENLPEENPPKQNPTKTNNKPIKI